MDRDVDRSQAIIRYTTCFNYFGESEVMEEKGKSYLHRERAFSTFRRRIGFGQRIDTEKASANMAEGILEIKLPKLEPKLEKKTKKITPQ